MTKAHDGFVVEIDGAFDSEYGSATAAFNVGLKLMQTHAGHAVKVYDTLEQAAEKAEPEFHWWMALDR